MSERKVSQGMFYTASILTGPIFHRGFGGRGHRWSIASLRSRLPLFPRNEQFEFRSAKRFRREFRIYAINFTRSLIVSALNVRPDLRNDATTLLVLVLKFLSVTFFTY